MTNSPYLKGTQMTQLDFHLHLSPMNSSPQAVSNSENSPSSRDSRVPFTLTCAGSSPIPNCWNRSVRHIYPCSKILKFDRIAGLPYAAIPIATAISLAGNYPMIYPRKEVKTYGTKAEIEGEYHAGETIVVIDDLATTGGSKFEAIEKLTGAGLVVKDVVVLVDRQSGAKESLAQAGYSMHAVLTIGQLLDYWEENGKVEKNKIEETRKFLNREHLE